MTALEYVLVVLVLASLAGNVMSWIGLAHAATAIRRLGVRVWALEQKTKAWLQIDDEGGSG